MNEKSSILVLTNIFEPDIGGPASFVRVIAPELAHNCRVTVVTYSPVWSYAGDKALPYKVVRVWKHWPRVIRHPLYLFKGLWQARKHTLLFVLSPMNPGLVARLARRLFDKPYIVRLVGDWAWEFAANTGRTQLLIDDFQVSKKSGIVAIHNRIQRTVCRYAAAVIVPSQYLATLVKGWAVPEESIHVIYNSTEFESTSMSREEARRKVGVPGFILLSVGRLVPWKDFRMLIKLMPTLLDLNGFFRLVIVGAGPELQTLETFIRHLHLEKKVFLVGRKSPRDLMLYMRAADILVLNTGYEGFSHVILEAMTMGVPVITTNVGGNREIVRQGENGFMVKYNDEFNLLEAIKTVWRSGELRERMIEEGKRTAREFTVQQMKENVLKVIRDANLNH